MIILNLLIPIALLLGLGFLVAFIRMSVSGQYDDLETPAYRILIEDPEVKQNASSLKSNPQRRGNV